MKQELFGKIKYKEKENKSMKKKKIIIIAGIAVVLIVAVVVICMNLFGGSRTGIDNKPEAKVNGDSRIR